MLVLGLPCQSQQLRTRSGPAGLVGLTELLTSLGWDVSEIVYQDDDHAVFTAPSHGKFASVHFNVENQPRTIRFKALNAAARQAAAEDAQTRRQLFRPSTRAE